MTETTPAHPVTEAVTEALARRRAFVAAWATIAGFLILQTTANAFSQLRDLRVDPREPFVWEYTSALTSVILVPGMAWLVRMAPPGRWLRFAGVHLAGSLAYCLLHVGGFVALRVAIYGLVHARYSWRPDLLYEYRKDLVAYLGFVAILAISDWAARLWARNHAPAGPRLYHLKDGARVVRVPMDEIVAVTAARNYVEFHLAGGRKPLVRDTLAKVEADLGKAGFLRTHRSWLVNPAHVRAVTPAQAGDFKLELASGLTVPLSRRFPEALESLRVEHPPLVPEA